MTIIFDKKQVIQSFNRAATQYDAAAVLQQEVARRLMERCESSLLTPEMILDLGSGTGFMTQALQSCFMNATLIALDFAYEMLRVARQQTTKTAYGVCGDATAIPIQANTIDMVVSNLMLQWCDDVPLCFTEVGRILSPQGVFHFTTFGPDTFCELRQAWHHSDDAPHVHEFVDMHHIGDELLRQGFVDPVMDKEIITVYYDDVMQIMRDIKCIGAHNLDPRRSTTLTGKKRLQTMIAAYEQNRTPQKTLPVTYEVIYGYAKAPVASSPRDAMTRIPVSSIGRLKR